MRELVYGYQTSLTAVVAHEKLVVERQVQYLY